MNELQNKSTISCSDMDKLRLFGIGSICYSGLTLCLHPLSVIKTRQQVLSTDYPKIELTKRLSYKKIRSLYRGVGVVITVAIPARLIYITVLEKSKEDISKYIRSSPNGRISRVLLKNQNDSSIAAISGGIAGGIASLSSQALIVPMDVIAQRQMIQKGTSQQIFNSLIKNDGWKGLYHGFGISMLTAIPGGASWWATYTSCQEYLHKYANTHPIFIGIDADEGPFGEMNRFGRNVVIQIISGSMAAFVAASLTQPLDVIKTRLQVGVQNNIESPRHLVQLRPSIISVGRELIINEGIKGLYRGIGPRIINIGIWGTVFSSAYELLKLISMKDVN